MKDLFIITEEIQFGNEVLLKNKFYKGIKDLKHKRKISQPLKIFVTGNWFNLK